MKRPKLAVAASSIQGVGVIVEETVGPGTPLFPVRGTRRSDEYDEEFEKGAHWFSLAPRTWIEPGPRTLARYLNHSCRPNAVWADTRWITSRVTLPVHTEIAIDYGTIELDPFWRMPCSCGASTCRRVIVPFYLEAPRVRQRLEPLAPEFLRDRWEECAALSNGTAQR